LSLTRGFGAITETIGSFAITNYTGYVIASDASNAAAGYDRDAIRTSAQVTYTTDNTAVDATKAYRVVFRLLDSGGNPVQIRNENGVADTSYTIDSSVTLPLVIFGLRLPSRTITYGGPLVPVAALSPYEQYTAEVRLYSSVPPFSPTFTGDVATDGPRTFHHFTNPASSDAALNVIAVMNSSAYDHTYMVNTDTAKDAFSFNTQITLHRYDGFAAAVTASTVTIGLDLELRDVATDAIIPLANNHVVIGRTINSYEPGSPNSPKIRVLNENIEFAPAAGVQLDAVNKTYKLRVQLTHIDTAPTFKTDNAIQMAPRLLMQFNGKLFFGGIETRFTSIANDPAFNGIVLGSHVVSQLAVDGNSGFVVGAADHTYGNGAALSVRLRANGNAELGAGSVVLNAPSPDPGTVSNVRFARGPITLDTVGARGNVTVTLPTGFGYRANVDSRILRSKISFANVPLNQALAPISDQVLNATLFVVEDTKPLWLEVSRILWKVNSGEFVMDSTSRVGYVRSAEMDALEAAPVVTASMRIKRSNELYFRSVDKVLSPQILVRADSNGHAQMSLDLAFAGGGQRAHFPYDARMTWTSGLMEIKNDLVVAGSSAMEGFTSILMRYSRDCPDGDCPGAVGPTAVQYVPEGGQMVFTEDGGLQSAGVLATELPLTWGWVAAASRYAHETDKWDKANFHMPGLFIRGDRTVKAAQFRPAVILFTGVLPSDPTVNERPGTTGYQEGFGDYAGVNFRVGADGDKKAKSTLAGKPTGDYPLTGRSKYYIRPAGVSGIHEAVFGSFPSSATLYGYQVNFDNFGLAFLDSRNTDSRTEGFLRVKAPSNIKQNFEKLTFTCLGALDKAEVPSSETGVMKSLEYWQADFVTQGIDFQSDAACNPGEGYLVLGVAAWASHVSETLYGKLGFRSNGNLITQEDGLLSGVNSRLKLPNTFKLKGPANQNYTVSAVGEAYYNNYEFAPGETGWINIAGKLDVPFFEDLKVHLHTSAQRDNTTAIIHLMGGWPSKGFEIAGKNYFTQTPFDLDNRGFPTDVNPTQYHSGNTPSALKYLVRAQRNWLNVVDFDYPLKWSTSTRSFTSYEPIENDLLIVRVEHQVKYLDAQNAEMTFGIEYDGMPKVNIANLAFNAIDEATGVSQAFLEAGLAPVRDAIDQGLGKMNQMLEDQMHGFFNKPFDDLLKPRIEALYDQLKANFNSVNRTWTISPNTTIPEWVTGGGAVVETFEKQLKNVTGGISAGVGVINEIDQNLRKVDEAISGIESILAESGGKRTIASQLIKKLVGQLAADFAGAFVDDKLNEFLAQADPTLDQIHSVLLDLKNVVTTIRGQLAGGAQFANELNAKITSLAADIHTVSVQAQNDIRAIFNGIDISIDDPFVHFSKQELVELVRQKLENRFFASKIPTAIQVIIKQRIYDLDASIRESIDSAFQQVNGVIKGVISETLADLDNSINGMLGDVNNVLGAGKITGYAHINNDALKLLRLDIYAQLKVPSEMELNAYIQIKELDSENFPSACLPASGKATEVSVGATDVKVDWISPDLLASIGFKVTFDSGVNPPRLTGVAGSFEMKGEVNFEAFKVKQFSASMAFGAEENYFSCAARVLINKYEGFGGIYFGRTCTLDPIKIWDPEVASVLGSPPFTGAYVYGEVWIPISEALLGIPATCFFNITAGVGAGAFYFVEGPTYGGKMLLGAHGELLCIVSVGGTIKLVGVKNPDGLTLKGTGEVEGEIGWCPFCISFSKSIDMTYKNGSWDVDF
jgi:hypothetical protein